MSSTQKTIKCPICGKPYTWYYFYAADQSACPKCRAEAEDDRGKAYRSAKEYKYTKE